MGLPLFIPPVESDLPSKPSLKGSTDPSHARSPIRRAERRRQLNISREQRLRILNNLMPPEYNTEPSLLTTLQRASASGARSFPQPPDTSHGSGRQSPQLENPRISELTDLERRPPGRSATGELSRSFAIDDLDDAWNQLGHVMPSQHFQTIHSSLTRPSQWSNSPVGSPRRLGYNTRRAAWRRGLDGDNEEPRPRPRRSRHIERRDLDRHAWERHALERHAELHRRRATSEAMANDVAAQQHASRARYVDGLGDRDRSLSPEGDGVWDTLQSTLTPDPQPPSVGSSFASTIASTATSEANGSTSINTSLTTPNEDIEPPCDPVTDNPGSDGEDDIEERPSRQMTPRGWRTYADVAAEAQSRQSTESADASDPDREWLTGMHRIVRGLASRGDIPDEWWAQAGLSRSMSWEDAL
ncbi:hypothetical protein GGR55DRAFT_640370 [Xylaria sp. FL0064]|nr:hypothetical protein GGR55DRAFT_640370 [Xylaria sp. FL0064]